ncbi:MAG: S49 family peptidase [Maricaulaceae bacterium]
MKSFLIALAGAFAALCLFVFVAIASVFGAIMAVAAAQPEEKTPANAVLTLDLRNGLPDQPVDTPFGTTPPSVIALVRALERAETDDRVKGLLIRAGGSGLSTAQAEELTTSLADFKATGKFVLAHAQGFDSTSLAPYHAVIAADEIWLQATAEFAPTGYASEVGFLGGVFEWARVEPQFVRREEYKNAVNTFTETEFTPAHREATQALLDTLYAQSLEAIAGARAPDLAALRAALNQAPLSAETAQAEGLIDTLGYWEDARQSALERAGDDADTISVAAYVKSLTPLSDGPEIALIGGQGTVVLGAPEDEPFAGGTAMGGDTLARALDAAAKDDAIEAVILRIDSPGGSSVASDQIWAGVERVKEAGKPVVARFGSVAASGGYYLAAGADAIVAWPTTLTGSIGVYSGKFSFEGAGDLIGYATDSLVVGGDYALAYSTAKPFTETQRARLEARIDDVYDDFTGRVADGRTDLSLAQVRALAKGRVWSGQDAFDRGLVDELGGLKRAIEVAKELAEIDAETAIRLRRLPRERTPFEQIQKLFDASAQVAAISTTLNEVLAWPEVRALIETRHAAQTRGVQARAADLPID